MKLFHASSINSKEILKKDFQFNINKSGTANNGDNQAAGTHFSEDMGFSNKYRSDLGCLISADVSVAGFHDFYAEAEISIYQEILEEFIGVDRLINLTDEIEELEKEHYGAGFDLYERVLRALIYVDDDLMEDIVDSYDITPDQRKQLLDVLDNSFEFYDLPTNEKIYEMLSATIGGRTKASEKLIEKGINGFKYKWPINDDSAPQSYCVLNVKNIKNINIEIATKSKMKMKI